MNTLMDDGAVEALVARFRRIEREQRPLWGSMSAGSMLRHLLDCQAMAMGERRCEDVSNWAGRKVLKQIALRVPFKWPRGVKTRPEFDPLLDGSKPGDYETDRELLVASLRRLAAGPRNYRFGRHPMFGAMSEWEWMRWVWLHADHHLRQFGG
jgi:hypothetical protein